MKIMLNGQELAATFESIAYSEHVAQACAIARRDCAEVVGKVEFETTLDPSAWREFERWLRATERDLFATVGSLRPIVRVFGNRGNESNASLFTLARRAGYGGRKGRRASRRVVSGAFGLTPAILEQSTFPHLVARAT